MHNTTTQKKTNTQKKKCILTHKQSKHKKQCTLPQNKKDIKLLHQQSQEKHLKKVTITIATKKTNLNKFVLTQPPKAHYGKYC